jgi:hypothetical protein
MLDAGDDREDAAMNAGPLHTVDAHFLRSTASVRATYDAILNASRALGPVEVEPKKTSIHLVRATAFAGIATRREALLLTLKSDAAIRSARVHRAEQASARRWHIEFRLASPKEVDRELRGWLAAAYALAA